jgi:DNA-binding response OmpR family regulator
MIVTASILVVEDDRDLADALVYNLRHEGYAASVARTGIEAITRARAEHPDLLLLDIMLPEMDGFEVCRQIRATSSLPIIMLSARGDELDRVLGLELGADDYVAKPFSLRELLARIRAMLRRVEVQRPDDELPVTVTAGPIEISVRTRTVSRHGTGIKLLPREFDLLLYLVQHRDVVCTREQLLENVWGSEYYGETRTVDVHVRRLRMKIEDDPNRPSLIRTVHGVGYAFQAGKRSR